MKWCEKYVRKVVQIIVRKKDKLSSIVYMIFFLSILFSGVNVSPASLIQKKNGAIGDYPVSAIFSVILLIFRILCISVAIILNMSFVAKANHIICNTIVDIFFHCIFI